MTLQRHLLPRGFRFALQPGDELSLLSATPSISNRSSTFRPAQCVTFCSSILVCPSTALHQWPAEVWPSAPDWQDHWPFDNVKSFSTHPRMKVSHAQLRPWCITWFAWRLDLPPWFINCIDKFRRGFLWRGAEEAKGGHYLVTWSVACLPRASGRLGIHNPRLLNKALASDVAGSRK